MRNNSAVVPGLSLFLCFCLLQGGSWLLLQYAAGPAFIAATEALVFLLPALLLLATRKQKWIKARLKRRKLPRGGLSFSIRFGLSVAMLSVCLNSLLETFLSESIDVTASIALELPQFGLNYLGQLLLTSLLAPLVEEIYLRGALLPVFESIVGTAICLLMNGIFYAMLYGDLLNFLGPMIVGIAYAYLSFVFRSVWPAVVAHIASNLYYWVMDWLMETYAAFGVWKYFLSFNNLLLLFFIYLTLRSWEKLLMRGYVPHFEKSAGMYDVWLLVRNPGMIAFLLAFLAKTVLHVI